MCEDTTIVLENTLCTRSMVIELAMAISDDMDLFEELSSVWRFYKFRSMSRYQSRSILKRFFKATLTMLSDMRKVGLLKLSETT